MDQDLNQQAAFTGFVTQPILQLQLYQQICPHFQPLSPYIRARDPSISQHEGHAAYWLQRLLEAAKTPLVSAYGHPIPAYRIRGQEELNDRARHYAEDAYSNRKVNLRLAVLFYIALIHHVGGPRYYPFGQGNEDSSHAPYMPFAQRLEVIASILGSNKRIVMDVMEGRGVMPFVQDPRMHNYVVMRAAQEQEAAMSGESAHQV